MFKYAIPREFKYVTMSGGGVYAFVVDEDELHEVEKSKIFASRNLATKTGYIGNITYMGDETIKLPDQVDNITRFIDASGSIVTMNNVPYEEIVLTKLLMGD